MLKTSNFLLADKGNNQADSFGEVPKKGSKNFTEHFVSHYFSAENVPGKTVKKDYDLRDDLRKDDKSSSHRVTAGAAITINGTKGDWSNITVTSTGASGWIPSRYIVE